MCIRDSIRADDYIIIHIHADSSVFPGELPSLLATYLCMNAALLGGLLAAIVLSAQTSAEYIGGTAGQIESGTPGSIALADEHYLAFYAGKTQIRVAYERVNLIEYGQQ